MPQISIRSNRKKLLQLSVCCGLNYVVKYDFVGLQYICYTVAYPEQEGEKGKVTGNQTENLPLGGGAELQKRW